MSKLVDKQFEFLKKMMFVIEFAIDMGYTVTFGEAYRTKEQATWYFERGLGILSSLHCSRRALDLNFFRGGKLVNDKVTLEFVGKYAEELGLTWGGRFKKYDDSGHFEL